MDIRATLVAHFEAAEPVEPGEPYARPPTGVVPTAHVTRRPRRAMRGMMPPRRNARRQPEESSPWSAGSCTGRRRRRPRRFPASRSGGIASTVASNLCESCTLAPDTGTASGTPMRSTTTWRLVPSWPRFVGSLPVCSPPQEPAHSRCRVRPASSPSAQRMAVVAGAPDASPSSRPRAAASRNRRQPVMPPPQPSSWGSISQADAALQDKVDPCQRGAIKDGPWASTLGLGRLRWQEGRDDLPQLVADQ